MKISAKTRDTTPTLKRGCGTNLEYDKILQIAAYQEAVVQPDLDDDIWSLQQRLAGNPRFRGYHILRNVTETALVIKKMRP